MLLMVRTMEILVLVLTESQGRHNSSCFICEPPSFSLQAPERMFPNGFIFHVTEREVLSTSLMLAFIFAIRLGCGPLRGAPIFRASGRIWPFPGALDRAHANPRASLCLQGKQLHFSGWMSISALLWGWILHFASCSAAGPSQAQWLPLCPEGMGTGACVGKLNVHLSHSCSSLTFPLGSAWGPWGQKLYLFVFPASLTSFSILEGIFPLIWKKTHLQISSDWPIWPPPSIVHSCTQWGKDRDRSSCNGKGHHKEFSDQFTPSKVREGFLRRKRRGQGVQQWLWHRAGHPLPPLPRGFASMDIFVWIVGSGWGRQIQTDGQGRIEGLWPALLSLPVSQLLGTLPGVGSGVNMGKGTGSTKPRPRNTKRKQ